MVIVVYGNTKGRYIRHELARNMIFDAFNKAHIAFNLCDHMLSALLCIIAEHGRECETYAQSGRKNGMETSQFCALCHITLLYSFHIGLIYSTT